MNVLLSHRKTLGNIIQTMKHMQLQIVGKMIQLLLNCVERVERIERSWDGAR